MSVPFYLALIAAGLFAIRLMFWAASRPKLARARGATRRRRRLARPMFRRLTPPLAPRNRRPFTLSREPGLGWFRILGVGLWWKDTSRHRLYFSERNGYRNPHWRWRAWHFRFLGRSKIERRPGVLRFDTPRARRALDQLWDDKTEKEWDREYDEAMQWRDWQTCEQLVVEREHLDWYRKTGAGGVPDADGRVRAGTNGDAGTSNSPYDWSKDAA